MGGAGHERHTHESQDAQSRENVRLYNKKRVEWKKSLAGPEDLKWHRLTSGESSSVLKPEILLLILSRESFVLGWANKRK